LAQIGTDEIKGTKSATVLLET